MVCRKGTLFYPEIGPIWILSGVIIAKEAYNLLITLTSVSIYFVLY